jgi:hypothetical protein
MTMMQPGDRVGWIGADGVLRIDTVRDPREVDAHRRLAARIESMQGTICGLLGMGESGVMSEQGQPKIRLSFDPNKQVSPRAQEMLDTLVHENLDRLNAMQEAEGMPPLADPVESE